VPPEGSVVTVGSFDGVHLGHRAVLAEIVTRARATGRVSVLVTFEPHPMQVVRPEAAPRLLTTPQERREVLAQTELSYVAILRFDTALRRLPPEGFVDLIRTRFGVRELVIGPDHGFGFGRAGDVALLEALGRRGGFAVDVVPPAVIDGAPVSSSRIREAVAAGALDQAERLLGRPYQLAAEVVPGARRGQRIGFPTANLRVAPDKLLPPDGVYAVWVEWRHGRCGGMLNQGARPTVGEDRAVEVNLFDFDGDLYGQWIRIEWVRRLRTTRRFPSLDALAEQLETDRTHAMASLALTTPARMT